MNLNQTITVSSEVLAQEISGEMVLLDLSSEKYLGLNEVGARVWQLLEEQHDLKYIFNILLEEYEVDTDILENDLIKLIADMRDAGVIITESKET